MKNNDFISRMPRIFWLTRSAIASPSGGAAMNMISQIRLFFSET